MLVLLTIGCARHFLPHFHQQEGTVVSFPSFSAPYLQSERCISCNLHQTLQEHQPTWLLPLYFLCQVAKGFRMRELNGFVDPFLCKWMY
ncbi:hypothetical protein K7X08_025658 [Anisodus acutangulus]|uniref:Uncharacterized protein n=1 Tax=Anisodus acutangulus TaxID=402998 RepID=A0A9Q1R992_9SOLA|nr:hypothetical protein K7X08_025658 [Anisodus acutangulus]